MFRRPTLCALTLALAATALPALAGGSAVAASAAAPRPASNATVPAATATADLKITEAAGMVLADGKFFVSSGDAVRVYSAKGALLATVPSQSGAAGLVASADGTRVYVALRSSSAVSTIDTTALKQTGLITGFPCATDLALAGAQLFVSYGCEAGAIARIDTTTEDAPVAVDESMSWYAPPRLAATAGRLVAVQQDATPADLVSYAVAGTEVTRGATVQVDRGDTLAVSPDGTRVAASSYSPYGVRLLDAGTLETTATLPTAAYPGDVAFSRQGGLLAQGLSTTNSAGLYVFNTATGALRTTRRPVVPGQPSVSIVEGSTVFSVGGDRVFALATGSSGGTVVLVTAPTTAPTSTSVTLALKPAATYGGKVVATATVKGASKPRVTFTVESNGTTRSTTVTGSASGVATASISAPYSGKITARYAGDTGHVGSAAVKAYSSPSRTTLTQSGYYKTVKGVRLLPLGLGGEAQGHGGAGRLPAGDAAPRGEPERQWVLADSATGYTNVDGSVPITMTQGAKGVTYRVGVRFLGDAWNRASSAPAAYFRIG